MTDLLNFDVIRNFWTFPGNAVPATPTTTVTGDPAIAGAVQTSWKDWAADIKSAVLWPVHKAESAYDVVTNAPKNISDFVSRAEDSAISAATGIGNWTKWIAVAIALVAVAYIVAVFAPALKGKR